MTMYTGILNHERAGAETIPTRICEWCSELFAPKKAPHLHRFCCHSCRNIANRSLHRQMRGPGRSGRCEHCNAPFIRRTNGGRLQKYCSEKCCSRARRRRYGLSAKFRHSRCLTCNNAIAPPKFKFCCAKCKKWHFDHTSGRGRRFNRDQAKKWYWDNRNWYLARRAELYRARKEKQRIEALSRKTEKRARLAALFLGSSP